ncbi:MAG: putative aminopeptidase FrvX [Cyclobacteriaceae bacterium]|jgi:putative aminopeptidase FrvX
MKTAESIVKTCNEYLNVPSVIGFEEPFFQHLEQKFSKDGLLTESLYNRYGRRVLMAVSNNGFNYDRPIAAHIDRHGLYKILDPNLVYFSDTHRQKRDVEYAAHAIKRINFDQDEFSQDHLEKVYNYFLNEQIEVYHPTTHEVLHKRLITDKDISIIDDYLTCNLSDLNVFNELPFPFLPLAFSANQRRSDPNFIEGQIDNTLSVAVITELFKADVSMTVILTTDEEIGDSWLYMERFFSKNKLTPRNLLVLDTSPYKEEHGLRQVQDGGAVVLRYADNYAAFNRQMTHKLRLVCQELEIPYDFKDLTVLKNGGSHLGNTELGKLIWKSGGLFSGTTLQLPTDEYHTNQEKTSLASIDNFFKVVKRFMDDQ